MGTANVRKQMLGKQISSYGPQFKRGLSECNNIIDVLMKRIYFGISLRHIP